MAYIDLKELATRESEQVEWKEGVADIDDVVATITAFANDYSNLGGGYVVCGAREITDEYGFPKLDIVGLEASRLKEVEGRVLTACRDYVHPPLVPQCEELPTSDQSRRVLVFIVPATRHAHALLKKSDSGRYYIRISRETREARNGLLRELLVRKGNIHPWDLSVHPDARMEDLDLIAFRDLLQRLGVWDPAKRIEDYLAPHSRVSALAPSFCIHEPLTGKLKPRNFALLLFGRDVQRFYPHAHAIFSLYPGTDRSEPHAERHEISTTLLGQIKTLIELLNTQAYMVMDKTNKEPNIVKYPRRALHEAVVNALVHRDYEAHHPVRVTAFADRIEVYSPGGLPSAVDRAKFEKGLATPVWRNQSLGWFLNKLQLAQAEGQGIATILRMMRDEGSPPPTFELTPESVLCVLPAHPRHMLVRDLQDIEQAIFIGQYDEAQARLTRLIERDPFNYRAVRLLCDLKRATGALLDIYHFVTRYQEQLPSFPAGAQIQLAEALLKLPEPRPKDAVLLAKHLFQLASQGRFEEYEARRIMMGLMESGESQEALRFIDRALATHPAWREIAGIRQLRGRALLQLAQKCIQTATNQTLPRGLKQRAWRQCRQYLDEADCDLQAALAHAPQGAVREHLELDMDWLAKLRKQATPPWQRHKH